MWHIFLVHTTRRSPKVTTRLYTIIISDQTTETVLFISIQRYFWILFLCVTNNVYLNLNRRNTANTSLQARVYTQIADARWPNTGPMSCTTFDLRFQSTFVQRLFVGYMANVATRPPRERFPTRTCTTLYPHVSLVLYPTVQSWNW